MKQFLLSIGLCLALVTGASAQIGEKEKRSQEVQSKIRQVDLMIQILPLVLTKEQIREILPAVEKSRAKQKQILASEDDEIIKLEKKLDEALKAGYESGAYPPRDLQKEVWAVTKALAVRRQIARNEIVEDLYPVIDKVFNAGQKKAAANSLDWKALDPSAKIDDTKEDQKIKFFIRSVFMDPAAYDVLVKLAK
jgi:hypothetical protein